MNNQANVPDAACYQRAAKFLAPRFTTLLSGSLIDGYWLDDNCYFFCVSEAAPDGAIVNRPKIANAGSGTITPVISEDNLANLISGHIGKPADRAALAAARFDMPEAEKLVATIGSDACHISLKGPDLIRIETLDSGIALYSSDGRYAAFLKDHAVWVRDRKTGRTWQLTPDGAPYYAYGVMPESGLSPLKGRKYPMPDGLWSPNSDWFVTHRLDERHLPESALLENVPVGGGRPTPHLFKVSSPDAELATAEFVAYHLPSGRSITADRRVEIGIMPPFLYKQAWFVGESIYFLDWNRFSSEVTLIEMPLGGGACRTVFSEKAEDGWIDLNPKHTDFPNIRPLPSTNELIWYSDKDGHAHLYLYDLVSGTLKNRITQGKWMVRDIIYVDEDRRRILFSASGFEDQEDPAHRRLCRVDFDGSHFDILLAINGDIYPVECEISINADRTLNLLQANPFRSSYTPSSVSPSGDHVIVQSGSVDSATRTLLLDIDAGRVTELARSNVAELWGAPKPQGFEVLAADGVTKLRGAMFLPTDFDPSKSYPLVDYIYPGPHVNWYVRRFPSWPGLDLQALAELGMVGVVFETRGMPNYSRSFHQVGHGGLLEPQLSDHVAVIEQLCQRHSFLNRSRIGIFGQSGGGYATARAMFDYPEIFKVGVSVCGNHDNRNYMAHWIDKYGPRPGTLGRDTQSNIQAAHKLEGKLLLIHGEMDENVHPAHTLAVCQALIAAGKEFDQLIVPNAGHMLMLEVPYVFQRIANYFIRNLIGSEPPSGIKIDWTADESVTALHMAMRSFA